MIALKQSLVKARTFQNTEIIETNYYELYKERESHA